MQWRGSRRRPGLRPRRIIATPGFPSGCCRRTHLRTRKVGRRAAEGRSSECVCVRPCGHPSGIYRRVAGNESRGWMPSAFRPQASGGGRALPSGPLLFTGVRVTMARRQFAKVATFATDLRPADPSTLDGATRTGFFPRNHRHDRRSRERSCEDDRGGGKGGDRIGCGRSVWAEEAGSGDRLMGHAGSAVAMQRQVSTP